MQPVKTSAYATAGGNPSQKAAPCRSRSRSGSRNSGRQGRWKRCRSRAQSRHDHPISANPCYTIYSIRTRRAVSTRPATGRKADRTGKAGSRRAALQIIVLRHAIDGHLEVRHGKTPAHADIGRGEPCPLRPDRRPGLERSPHPRGTANRSRAKWSHRP